MAVSIKVFSIHPKNTQYLLCARNCVRCRRTAVDRDRFLAWTAVAVSTGKLVLETGNPGGRIRSMV